MPTIAVLSSNAALSALLAATLRRAHHWRVREFGDRGALEAYVRIAPVAVMVADYDLGDSTAAELAMDLRSDPMVTSPEIQIIALARSIDLEMRERCTRAGIDEVVVKPMSPLYLEERIQARLERGSIDYVAVPPYYIGPERRDRIAMMDLRLDPVDRRQDNVVSFMAHRARRDAMDARPDA